MSIRELHDLHVLWQQGAQARAYGGLRAISGFTFQVECAIERALESFVKSPNAGPSILVEAISDIADIKHDFICAVQVKRTLTSTTWKSAVEEFAEIQKLTEEKRPDLAGRLRFEIICREDRRSSKIISEEGDAENALRVKIAPNPRTSSLVLLWHEFHAEDPLLSLRELSARIHEILARQAPTETGEEIWSFLTRLWKVRSTALQPPGILVQASTYEKDPSSPDTEVLLSRQPTFSDLRLGRVMERSETLDSVMGELETWLQGTTKSFVDVSRSFEHALQVFWIAGRSGDGKSVALLLALARLHRQGYGPILFLGNDLRDLPRALELLAEWEHEGPAIVAVDDPYGKDIERGGNLWTQVWNFVNKHDALGISPKVVVIACGPSEQCDRFEAELGEAVRVLRFPLHPVNNTEIQKLSAWYTKRTGQPCGQLTEKNPLMVQLVFELRHGSIERFATRFRRRLAEIGLASPQGVKVESPRPIDIALALNRLYVTAPKDLLTDTQLDNLVPLLKEEHFEFNQDHKSEGLRLAHPHLANIIYNVWFPEGHSRNTRISHIVTAFGHQLKKRDPRERFFILWALRPEVGRVTEDFLRDCVPKLYDLYLDSCSGLSDPSGLPGWIALSNWWEAIVLHPNPVTLAIKHLKEGSYEATGTRLICHQLLERARIRDDPECVEAVVGLLRRSSNWREWPWIVSDLIQLNTHQSLLKRLGVLQMALSWIDDHPSELEVPLALINLKGVKWNEIGASIKRSLRAAQEHPSWPRLCWSAQTKARAAQMGTNENRELNEIALDWCERHPLSHSMVFLVGNVLRVERGSVRAETLARLLTERDNLYPHNNFILEPLLATGSLEWAKSSAAWVLGNSDHPSPSFVLERLSAYYDANSPVGSLTIDWLRQNQDDGGWTYVWKAWFEKSHQEPLFEVGRDWLVDHQEHGGWPIVWKALADVEPTKNELTSLACAWLRHSPNHGGWLRVWSKLQDIQVESQEVRDLADRAKTWIMIEKASSEGETVEGVITEKLEDGFFVNVGDTVVEAFLPTSQASTSPSDNLDKLVGLRDRFAVLKYWGTRANVVVSRKARFEKEFKVEVIKALKEGTLLEGEVKGVTDYAAFVDLGGVTGILHKEDMTWRRIAHPSEIVRVGDRIKLAVIKFNPKQKRPFLGLKQTTANPWDSVGIKYLVGSRIEGRVVGVVDFGAFVELEPGIEGLIHVSDMAWGMSAALPSTVFHIGQKVLSEILSIDTAKQRITLGLKQLAPDPWDSVGTKYLVGSRVEGRVTRITDFGVFIELEPGVDGLIHVSEMTWSKKKPHPSEVLHVEQAVQSEILSIDLAKRRIALGLKQFMPDPWNYIQTKYLVGSRVEGRVTSITNFGAFIELEPEVDGLIHITEMSWDRSITHPSELVAVGEKIYARVIRADPKRQQLSLSIKQLYNWVQPDPWTSVAIHHPVGSRARGVVKFIRGHRIFIELEPGLTGYVPSSSVSPNEESADLAGKIAVGDEVDVIVIEIDQSRPRLRLSLIESSFERGVSDNSSGSQE